MNENLKILLFLIIGISILIGIIYLGISQIRELHKTPFKKSEEAANLKLQKSKIIDNLEILTNSDYTNGIMYILNKLNEEQIKDIYDEVEKKTEEYINSFKPLKI